MTDLTAEKDDVEKPASLADKANDPNAALDSVIEAASFSANLWLSYLFLLFYLLVSVGGVRQQDLFLENPVQLPFLGVALPLVGFFWLGPVLFVIIHAYILLHISLLAEKVGILNSYLDSTGLSESEQTKIRRQLPNNIFVYFLAGPPEAQKGVFGLLLMLIIWISLVFGPVLLLIFFQLQFLPFHDWEITLVERLAAMSDLALLWALWPTTVHGGIIGEQNKKRSRVTGFVLVGVAAFSFALVFLIATFPGEWLNAKFSTQPGIAWVRTKLVHGNVDLVSGRPTSLWSDQLVLVNFDAIDHTKFNTDTEFAQVQSTYSLRGRDLQEAVFVDDDLRKMDFEAANLTGARFDDSNLRDALFRCIDSIAYGVPMSTVAYDVPKPTITNVLQPGIQVKEDPANSALGRECTKLQGAIFIGSDLRNADFEGAQLQNARFGHAKLQAANLNGANLYGADFGSAQLQGASLQSANLNGTHFLNAQLQGATLFYAHIEGANLTFASLQGSFLDRADLRNTIMISTNLEGASLDFANVQYANLNGAQFLKASLQSANFDNTAFGQSDFSGADLYAANIQHASTDQAIFQNTVLDAVNPAQVQAALQHRFQVIGITQQKYDDSLADEWKELGCSAASAPYVLGGLIDQMTTLNPFGRGSPELSQLASDFLSPDCKGNVGLSDDERASLESLISLEKPQ